MTSQPPSNNTTLWACSQDNPCKDPNLCCGKDGFCSAAADACDVNNGCQGNCKDIPDPSKCQDFRSSLFSNPNKTKTRPMFTTERPVSIVMNSTGIDTTCNNLLPSVDYPMQPCDLVAAMGGPDNCKYCLYYYDRIREAAEAYDLVALSQLDCNAKQRQGAFRLAAFLAQIHHETAGLKTMYQPIDNGSGAIHMTPHHFESLYKDIPRIQKAIDSILPGLVWKNVQDDIKLQRIIGLIISNPEHTFLTAGWWFVKGANQRLSSTCGDLREAADMGRGNYTNDLDTTGFYQVSRCVYSSVTLDPGLQQRLSYYDQASNVTSLFTPVIEVSKPTGDTTTDLNNGETNSSNNDNPSGFTGPTAFFASFGTVFLAVLALFTIYDRIVRRPRRTTTKRTSSSLHNMEAGNNTLSNNRQIINHHNHMTIDSSRPRLDSGTNTYLYERVDLDRPMRAVLTSSMYSLNSVIIPPTMPMAESSPIVSPMGVSTESSPFRDMNGGSNVAILSPVANPPTSYLTNPATTRASYMPVESMMAYYDPSTHQQPYLMTTSAINPALMSPVLFMPLSDNNNHNNTYPVPSSFNSNNFIPISDHTSTKSNSS